MEINITILVQLLAFLFLLAWLSKFLFEPLMRLINEREARIEGAKTDVIAILQKAHKHQQQVEAKVHEAQKKARQEMATLKAQGAEESRKIIEEAKSQARKKLEVARASLGQEVQKVTTSLRDEASVLASEVLAKVVSPESSVRSFTPKNEMECRSV